ncbi:unnamed protein product [Musa textilis]
MGKNQAYKAMQRARLGSSSAGPEEVEDGMTDGSFHSPEWHAARLANLKTSHTITWEEFKRKQKEDELKRDELEADKDRMMREYRAQLDAERARKLSLGKNHSARESHRRKDKKDKDSKKQSSRKRKHKRSSSQVPPVHHLNRQAVMMIMTTMKGNQRDQDQRDQRRKGSIGQGSSTLAVTTRRMVDQSTLQVLRQCEEIERQHISILGHCFAVRMASFS